jgi:prolyl oligopeptidase
MHPPVPPPPATRREPLVEHLHGHEVADPYRWLEDPTDPEVATWAAAQWEAARAHLDALTAREGFRRRLERLWDHERRGAPWRRGEVWLQLRHAGLANQPVLHMAEGGSEAPPPESAWRVLLDPNAWSADGTAALSAAVADRQGRRLAYAISHAGSDWMTWHVRDLATGDDLGDEVPWAKFASAAWLPDGSGFLYGAYPAPEPGQEHAAAMRDHQLRLHRLGTPAEADTVVHARPDQPEWGFSPTVSDDGRWLVLSIFHGTSPRNRLHLAPIVDGVIGEVRPWLDDADARYELLGILDDEVLVSTDLDAPLGRVLAIDANEPRRRRELVAEREERLDAARLVGGGDGLTPQQAWLVCHHLHHATSRVTVHGARDGVRLHEVDLGAASVREVAGGRRDTAVHLVVESFTQPSRVLCHDLEAATTEPSFVPDTLPPPTDLVTERVHVHHDGVAVPLFLVRRADVAADGSVPTVLWGYGGFDIPVTPMFQPAWRAWVDAGGLLAVACLRGGGEYGRAWHDAGRLANKQAVFDDALACAAWLTGRREEDVHARDADGEAVRGPAWSAPAHLGIEGRSNGGALVGACLTQSPESFGSAVPEVGVLDLLRFHRWTIGWAWISDYGSPDDPEEFATLLAWSPYHNLREGVAYPPTLLTTADTDDRVVPAHSYKFAAALQHAQEAARRAGSPGAHAPVLLRVEVDAGHGAGKPTGKLLRERADVLAFHAHHLGLSPRWESEA